MWLLVVLLVLSVAANVTLGIILRRAVLSATEKLDTAEQFIFNMLNQLEYVLETIRRIDARGAFEADDEVGIAFQAIKETIMTLNAFTEVERLHETS